jgi:hypothetical protein
MGIIICGGLQWAAGLGTYMQLRQVGSAMLDTTPRHRAHMGPPLLEELVGMAVAGNCRSSLQGKQHYLTSWTAGVSDQQVTDKQMPRWTPLSWWGVVMLPVGTE